jgi:predicted O-methyltransferase YrrM
VAAIAKKNFEQLNLTNIRLTQGNFDVILPTLLKQIKTVDFCFIDGNHQYEPTLAYFKSMLPEISNDSILVFDDIHWSAGMEQAWREIQADEKVRCTVDLFFLGIVFFREEFREKQHFSVRF